MQQDLNRVIEQVSKEKGIDKSILISALENAMISAAKKTFGHQRKIEAQFNPEIGEVELFEAKTVVENVQDPAVEVTLQEAREALDPDAEIGDELLSKLDSSMFGRIAAQAAKQNIVQRVRDAHRDGPRRRARCAFTLLIGSLSRRRRRSGRRRTSRIV